MNRRNIGKLLMEIREAIARIDGTLRRAISSAARPSASDESLRRRINEVVDAGENLGHLIMQLADEAR